VQGRPAIAGNAVEQAGIGIKQDLHPYRLSRGGGSVQIERGLLCQQQIENGGLAVIDGNQHGGTPLRVTRLGQSVMGRQQRRDGLNVTRWNGGKQSSTHGN